MQTSNRTESENLFEELCLQHGVEVTRLPVCSESQQPDYELVLASGQKVIAEVKQINPNENDRRAIEDLECKGLAMHGDNFARTVPNRVPKRSHEKPEADQLISRQISKSPGCAGSL